MTVPFDDIHMYYQAPIVSSRAEFAYNHFINKPIDATLRIIPPQLSLTLIRRTLYAKDVHSYYIHPAMQNRPSQPSFQSNATGCNCKAESLEYAE